MATCWRRLPCDTFLNSERQEVVELPDCFDECDIYEFSPFYAPFDEESFAFTLVKQKGIEEELIPITEFRYSDIDGVFRLKVPEIPSCKCHGGCTCGCEPSYKLVVRYIAGYDKLPDCLLPVFCEALQWVHDKNVCDCSDCQPCNPNSIEVTEMNYAEGATLTDRLADYFMKTLTKQYIRELSLISLCDRQMFKGFVV